MPLAFRKNCAPSGTKLSTLVRSGRPKTPLGETIFDVREDFRFLNQFFPEQFRDQLAGEIVGSRTKAAGGDDQIRAAQRFAHGLLDFVSRVRDRHLSRDDVAEVRQPAAEPLLMRVQHASQHQFAAGVDDFNVHGREETFTSGPFFLWPPTSLDRIAPHTKLPPCARTR